MTATLADETASRHPTETGHAMHTDDITDADGFIRLEDGAMHVVQDGEPEAPIMLLVRAGHGDPTMIGDEASHLEEWIARGH